MCLWVSVSMCVCVYMSVPACLSMREIEPGRRVSPPLLSPAAHLHIIFTPSKPNVSFFDKQPHSRVEPRVAIEMSKMSLIVAMKFTSIFGIEVQGCLNLDRPF